MVEVDFTLPEHGATNVMTWKCHVYNSSKGRYDMILVSYIKNRISLNLKISDHVIKADDGLLKGLQHPWVVWVCISLKKYREITPE